jgi:voltage-gated potassium channel Kch
VESAGAIAAIVPRPATGHYILCGLGRIGSRVLEYLRATGNPITVIDTRDLVAQVQGEGLTFVRGDCRQREVLEAAGVERAAAVLIVSIFPPHWWPINLIRPRELSCACSIRD